MAEAEHAKISQLSPEDQATWRAGRALVWAVESEKQADHLNERELSEVAEGKRQEAARRYMEATEHAREALRLKEKED